MTVLGIDPGRDKSGVAVCEPGRVIARAIVPPAEVLRLVARWTAEYQITAIVVGAGTGAREILAALRALPALERSTTVALQEETRTTLDARRLYFDDHPRRGWRRWVPLSFQVPPEPYDDYAAAVIADRYIHRMTSTAAMAGPTKHNRT